MDQRTLNGKIFQIYIFQFNYCNYLDENDKAPLSLSSPELIRLTKKVFGITQLKYFDNMYINSSGA